MIKEEKKISKVMKHSLLLLSACTLTFALPANAGTGLKGLTGVEGATDKPCGDCLGC
jgi:hypothetical protein